MFARACQYFKCVATALIQLQITSTNDLTALALSCSILYSLAIPHIYSRFDIIWPDGNAADPDPRNGVDALTHGLATLVMGEDVFGEDQRDPSQEPRPHPGLEGYLLV